MSNSKLSETDIFIGIKILAFRFSVTIERGQSLLTVRHHELFENGIYLLTCDSSVEIFLLGLMLLVLKRLVLSATDCF